MWSREHSQKAVPHEGPLLATGRLLDLEGWICSQGELAPSYAPLFWGGMIGRNTWTKLADIGVSVNKLAMVGDIGDFGLGDTYCTYISIFWENLVPKKVAFEGAHHLASLNPKAYGLDSRFLANDKIFHEYSIVVQEWPLWAFIWYTLENPVENPR